MNAVLTDDEVGVLLTAAAHAPSMYNTQPWRFEVQGSVIDVLSDDERSLPIADPAGRGARIAIGAAAFNLRVASAVLGHKSRLAVNPDPNRPQVVARLFLDDRGAPVPELGKLYAEMSERHTNRGPLLDIPVPRPVQRHLDEAARLEGAELRWLDSAARSRLAELQRQADAADLVDEERLHERLRWISGDRTEDGIPAGTLGPLPAGPAFVRDLALGLDSSARDRVVYEKHPAIAVLGTEDEDSAAWVGAGVALQRVLLMATSYDLAASFLNQVLERPADRARVRELIGGRSWPQMVLRVGYPAQPAGRTPRLHWHSSFDRWF